MAEAVQAEDLRAACGRLERQAPRPLLIVDVDEVLALFVQGFDAWLRSRGFELRMDSFALFSNLFPLGADAPAPVETGKALLEGFFAQHCHSLPVAPGAAEALARVARSAQVVVLTNAPECSRRLRGEWLAAEGLDYPLVVNAGAKGPAVKALAQAAGGPAAFVDDLLPNLDSAAEHAPQVRTFQMVADPGLRRLAPSAPERHPRIDDWPALADALERALT